MKKLLLVLFLGTFSLKGGNLPSPGSGIDIGPGIALEIPPSVVIGGENGGFRHALQPSRYPGFIGFETHQVSYTFELLQAPEELTITDSGLLEWTPGVEFIGESHSAVVQIIANVEGFEPLCRDFTIPLNVVDHFPKFADQTSSQVQYEGYRLGASGVLLEELDDSRSLLRWSLINPPPGVRISETGFISWDTSIGSRSSEPLTFRVRAEYDTASGIMSDETTLTYILQGPPPENDWSTFRASSFTQKAGALMGWDMAQAGGWLAATEPFIHTSGEAGSVRLWQQSHLGSWSQVVNLQPHFQQSNQAFGASTALTTLDSSEVLAIGAPRFSNGSSSSAGAIYLYQELENAEWNSSWGPAGFLTVEYDSHDLRFGSSLDFDGNILVASAPGHEGVTNTIDSGAFYLFEKDESGQWAETHEIINPSENTWNDEFGFPSEIDGSWIAVAATGDDDQAENAGAVYLYQKQGADWIQQQKVFSQSAAAEDRFGSRLCLSGEWLFIGAPDADGGKGVVEIFKLLGGEWIPNQSLTLHPTEEPQFFGASIDRKGETLIISSPGGFARTIEDPLGGNSRAEVSVYRLSNDEWFLDRVGNESLTHHENPHWGHKVILLDEESYAASHPNYSANNDGDPLTEAGRIFEYLWSNDKEDWASYQESLISDYSDGIPTDGDVDLNGVSNLMEWVWGLDPVSHDDALTFSFRDYYRPFLDLKTYPRPRLMVPVLKRTAGVKISLLVSHDLENWTETEEIEWSSAVYYYFTLPGGGRRGGPLESIILPPAPAGEPMFYCLKVTLAE